MEHLVYNRIELLVPADWSDVSVITLVSPEEGGIRASAVASSEVMAAPDIASYAREQAGALKRSVRAHRLLREEPLTVAGDPAFLLEHTFKTPENVTLQQVQLFVAKDGVAYVLSVTDERERFARAREQLLRIVHGFRVSG